MWCQARPDSGTARRTGSWGRGHSVHRAPRATWAVLLKASWTVKDSVTLCVLPHTLPRPERWPLCPTACGTRVDVAGPPLQLLSRSGQTEEQSVPWKGKRATLLVWATRSTCPAAAGGAPAAVLDGVEARHVCLGQETQGLVRPTAGPGG